MTIPFADLTPVPTPEIIGQVQQGVTYFILGGIIAITIGWVIFVALIGWDIHKNRKAKTNGVH